MERVILSSQKVWGRKGKKRIYGTDDPVKAAKIQKERMKQIIGVQSQQQIQPQPTQTTPGQLLPGYSITTGQPVTQPYKLEPSQVSLPLEKTEVILPGKKEDIKVSPQQTQVSEPLKLEQKQELQTIQFQQVPSPPYTTLLHEYLKRLETFQSYISLILTRCEHFGECGLERDLSILH